MGKALEQVTSQETKAPGRKCDWRRGMSDNVAYALLIYTALQIFVTVGAMDGDGSSILPYFGLVILVVAIIPACRFFERRWSDLTDDEAASTVFSPKYRRDQFCLWFLAIGLPFALTAFFQAVIPA